MKKTALVTDLKIIDSPQAGIGAARCLKESGLTIIGVDDTPFVTLNKDLFNEVFCWEEIRTLNLDSLVSKISKIKENYGLDYIFPCYDETIILFSFIKDRLDYLKIKFISPPKETIKAIQKINLPNIITGKLNNFVTPEIKIASSVEEAIDFTKKIGYPVVCKGLVKGSYICENEEDLIYNVKKLSILWNGGTINCIIQKCINDEKKEKTKEILPFAEYLVNSLPFEDSIIEIETIKVGDIFYVYEINPRSPAWIYAPCQMGLNIPELIINNSENKINFIKEEGYFGREIKDFIRKDIGGFENNVRFYSKGAAYKSGNLKYPSELL